MLMFQYKAGREEGRLTFLPRYFYSMPCERQCCQDLSFLNSNSTRFTFS